MVKNRKSSDEDTLAQRLDLDIALEAAGLGVWEFDPTTNRVHWDERCANLFGIRQGGPFAYEDTLRYVHPDDRDWVNQAIQWTMNPASGGHYDITYRTLGEEGRARWIRSIGRSYFDEAGRATRFAGVARDVTDLVQNRRKAEAIQQQVLSSFEQSPVGIAVISADNLTFRMANPFYGRLVDRTPEQLVGKSLLEALPELAGQGFDELLRKVITTGQPYMANEVKVILVRQGRLETIYVDLTYQPQRETDGIVSGVLVVAVDVTEQVLARQKIEQSEAQFRALVEEAPVATCLFVGRELRIDLANDAMIQVLGKGPGVVGMPLAQALPELAGQPFLPLLDELFTTGKTYSAKGGRADLVVGGTLQTFYFDYDFKPLRAADGTIYAILETAVDVTEQVTARRKIEQSEERFRSLVEQAPVAMAIFRGPEHVIELVNEAHLKLWGREAHQVLGKPLFEALPEVKGLGYEELLANVMTTGEPFYARELSAPLVRNGRLETVYFNFVYQPLRELDGSITSVSVVAVDVTEQVLARQKIEQSEARFRALVEEAPMATCLLVGRELRIEVANDAIINIWGKGPSVLGKPLAVALPELVGQPFLGILDNVFTTGETYQANGARANLVVDGVLGTYYFDFTYKPLRNAAGEVYAILDTAVDVTEQVLARRRLEESEARYRFLAARLEEQVQQRTEELKAANEELAATNEELRVTNEEYAAINGELTESTGLLLRSNDNLQKFAYVASHDLQEPLRKIQSFGDLLKNQHRDQLGDGITYLERMQSAANRMSTLIRDLLSYSRITTQRDQQEPVSLGAVVDTVLNDLELVIAETGAQLTIGPLPTITGDALQLGQLFQNLLSNALKFRRPGVVPHIEIRAQTVDGLNLPPTVKPARVTKQYHRIDVADNGVGFDEKYLDRIFQVFQRLHGRGEYGGTGIGLAICEKVVANHGGAITATSRPGQGATFQVYLPI